MILMGEEKMVSRKVAIALGIIIVVLVASLIGTVGYYNSIIGQKDNTISSLQGQVNNLNYQVNFLNNQVNRLIYQVNNLTNIVNLNQYTVWVNNQTVYQSAGFYTSWRFPANYAGYVFVSVQSSTENTYVSVFWYSHGTAYYNIITVGVSGTAVFPVLPTSSVEINVGNTNSSTGATETVSITYWY
jgi:predicted PurR-regulated permease PerM